MGESNSNFWNGPTYFATDKLKPQVLFNIFFIQVAIGAEFLNGDPGTPGFTYGFADLAEDTLRGMEGDASDIDDIPGENNSPVRNP